ALTLYEGAIHMVQSVPYQVERLDWLGRKAYVRRTFVDYYTDAIDHTKLKVLERFEAAPLGAGQCETGEVHVVRRVSGYKKIRFHTHENIGYGPVQLPDQELQTTATWWQLPPSILEPAFVTREQALAAFHGAGHALHCVAQLAVMAEGRDLQKCVDDAHPDGRFHPALYLFDAYPGGIGLSQPLFERRVELVKRARGLVAACPCTRGCPACGGPVAPPSQDEAETPTRAAQRLLTLFEAA
ncbi:MAG: Zn-binding domain-containing protein, partial [Silanimonas sp.]